jgi:hypothetical protein
VTTPNAVFREATADFTVKNVPLSHLSLELGHLYREDFADGPEKIAQFFRSVAPWAEAARRSCAAGLRGGRPRIATCFLIDDYFAPFSSPEEVVPLLMKCARENDLTIDYIVREAGCAEADGIALAPLVESRLVSDPVPGTNGDRPPTSETGWLCNGQRTPHGAAAQAMGDGPGWRPPVEHAATRHSVFVDVQLWDGDGEHRTWACAFLAAVWQLLRLGLLRYRGGPVALPHPAPAQLPDDWRDMPAVTQMNPDAAPFCAYRTASVLGSRFLATEHAVRTILSQVAVERAIGEQVTARAAAEGIDLPVDLLRRIEYVFINE